MMKMLKDKALEGTGLLERLHPLIRARIDECRDAAPRSNCRGTALYVTNERPDDVYTGYSEGWKHLDGMDPLEKPILGCIAVWIGYVNEWSWWNKKVPRHMGIVTSLDPILVTGRDRYDGPMVVDQPISQLCESEGCEPVFYLPKLLRKNAT